MSDVRAAIYIYIYIYITLAPFVLPGSHIYDDTTHCCVISRCVMFIERDETFYNYNLTHPHTTYDTRRSGDRRTMSDFSQTTQNQSEAEHLEKVCMAFAQYNTFQVRAA